jgi:acylphosphatase
MKVRVHVFISGHVQGVSFRYHIKEHAEDLDVNGWVKNLPDSRVEAVFEGEKTAVDQMIEYCKNGPVGATISDVQVLREKFTNEFTDFTISF